MSNRIFNRLVLFIFLILFQGLILNKIAIAGFVTPYFYIMFIFLLPFEIKHWQLVLCGFFLGLFVDMFTGYLGVQAFSCMLLGFLRPYLIKWISGLKTFEGTTCPCIADLGWGWFFGYTFLGTLIFQSSLVLIETFNFHNFSKSIVEVLLNTLLAVFLFMAYQYIFVPSKR